MDSGLIGKLEKAKRYAEEPERFHFNKFKLIFRGANREHIVTFENNVFSCDCEHFFTHRRCGHIMALKDFLEGMINEEIFDRFSGNDSIDGLAGDSTTDAPLPAHIKKQKRG